MDKKERQAMILKIIETEWLFFDLVENVGGRASCQDDQASFTIMRKAQFDCWSDETLVSYAADLVVYRKEGFNPISAKYGYMMAYYDEEGYNHIKDDLKPVTDEQMELIEKISRIQIDMTIEFYKRHNRLKKATRPIFSIEDSVYDVSQETYLRGELCTYSVTTLQCYLAMVEDMQAKGENICTMTMDNTAKYFGYKNAADMEAKMFR